MKRLLFISFALILALSMILVGCSAPTNYTLTIANPTGGSVFPAAGEHSYTAGTIVDIKATPAEGYNFVNWTGDVDNVANVNAATTKITMDADASIAANFVAKPWDTTITLECHLTVPNAQTSVAAKVYLPWIAELEAINGTKGGHFKVNVTYGDTPYDSTNSLWGIGSGVVDMGQLNGDNFKLGTIGTLPWYFPSITTAAYTYHKLWRDEATTWDSLGELDDVKVLIASPTWGSQWFGNFNATTLAAFAGKKVRAEPSEAPFIQALGAIPVTIPTSDIANQLMLKTIDGCFFTYSAWNFGIHTATSYVTEVDVLYRPYMLAMNKAVYDSLPGEARTALDSICTAEKAVALAKSHLGAQGFSKGKVTALHPIDYLSPTELAAWKTATAGVATKWASDMTKLGFDGTGILARAQALIAATPS